MPHDGVDWIARAVGGVGVLVSIVLGVIKYSEYRRTRVALKATYIWRSSADLGNSILVMNESTLPVCIYNFQVVAKSKSSANDAILVDNEDEFSVITIEALSAHEFTFVEQDHFPIASKIGTVFLKLWVVGRRNPVWLELA